MGELRNRQSAEILGSVYKNAQMAYEASNDVLRHCRSSELCGGVYKFTGGHDNAVKFR